MFNEFLRNGDDCYVAAFLHTVNRTNSTMPRPARVRGHHVCQSLRRKVDAGMLNRPRTVSDLNLDGDREPAAIAEGLLSHLEDGRSLLALVFAPLNK